MAGAPRDRLKNALVEVGKFARSVRNAAPMIFADLAHGNKEAFAFLSANFTEHIGHISALAGECRAESAVKGHSIPYIVGALVPGMVFPVIIGGILERNGVKSIGGAKLADLAGEFFSDAGIEDRAEIALRGIGL